MWQRLKDYLTTLQAINYDELNQMQKKEMMEELLQQIAFFQHERLVHLIVTVTFALCAFLNLFVVYFTQSILFAILEMLLIIPLCFYVLHYYRLENGTQKLYRYFDKLK